MNKVTLMCRIFLPFAAGYFLSNLYRVINAVIAPDLEHDLGITASELGLLSSAYFFAFACFQLPLGVMLDRYGPRHVVAIMLLVTGIGSTVFATGDDLFELTVGRALIGLGLSACLMASFKSFSQWFERQNMPAINGYLMACGGLGAITATTPIETFLEIASWRILFVLLAVISAGISMMVWLAVPEYNSARITESLKKQMYTVCTIFFSPSFRVVLPVAFFTHGFGLAIISLWSGPWLRDVAGFDRAYAAYAMSLLMFSMAIGYPLWGMIAVRLSRTGITLTLVATTGCVFFLLMNIIVFLQPASGLIYVWMLYGLALSSCSLFYATLSSVYHNDMAGRVNTALNLVVFVSAFVFQWGIGMIVDYWRFYAGGSLAQGYQIAFGLAVVLQSGSLWWLYSGRRLLEAKY